MAEESVQVDPLDEKREYMIMGCMAQFEDLAPSIAGKEDQLLKAPDWKADTALRGAFTQNVQSIYSGQVDAGEACRMLAEELAPFVDGPALATVLRASSGEVTNADNLYGEIVDSFVIRAMDDLARGLLALALGRPKDFPATCETYRHLLEREVPKAKALIAGA